VKPINILLVEDNPGDVRLTREALKDCQVPSILHVVEDGEAALRFLRREGDYARQPRPDLILLDLNLPRRDGRQVLAEVKEDPALLTIPVVILSTSSAEEDVTEAYRLHANCYLTKPMRLDQYMDVVRSIGDFWVTKARLPLESNP
jgi:CheY-like chemotaxis protein